MHDPDNCFCGEDFTGQCPCGCPACVTKSIDPVQVKQEEDAAGGLLALIEMFDDHQWKQYLRWVLIDAPGRGELFPLFVDARLEVQYADWDKLSMTDKLRHEEELLIREEFDQRCAEAEAMCAIKKRQAAKRYLARMRKLKTGASRAIS